MGLLLVFGVWGTISALTSVSTSSNVIGEWEKFIKIITFAFVISAIITTKERIDSVLFIIFLSLGFHGIVSGLKFIASGGSHHIYGPGTSIIADNNHFALAMIALLPVVLYLYKQVSNYWIKLTLIGSSGLIAVSVMGTFSRGGLLGIAAVASLAFLRSKQKIIYALVVVPLVLAAVAFAPESWSMRMDTITTAGQDESFMGRVIAWKQSTLIALDHPWFGGGFFAVQDPVIWAKYAQMFYRLDFIPTNQPDTQAAYAAHSIYFQVLGDLGFVGLFIFLAILISAWRNASYIMKLSRDRPEWQWAHDLALAFQYGLFAYMISGAALSMAYFDYMYVIFAILIVVRRMLTQGALRKETRSVLA